VDGVVLSRTKEDKVRSRCTIIAIAVFGAALLVATATAAPTPPGLKAWGERLQGEALMYRQLQQQDRGPTPAGLKAWGERLQGEALVYRQLGSDTVQSAANRFDWGDAVIGGLLGFALAAGCVGVVLARRRFAWALGPRRVHVSHRGS
jgi:hypothetical protein